MTRQPPRVVALGRHLGDPDEAAPATTPATESAWRRLHRLLKGHYPLAVLLVVAGMAGGAYLGFRSTEPLYQQVALIHIAPSMPSLRDPEGRSVLPDFDGFIQWHVALLESARATQFAVASDTWQKKGRGGSDGEALQEFEEHRVIAHKRGTQYIEVQFLDPDPQVAVAGAAALIDAYRRLSE